MEIFDFKDYRELVRAKIESAPRQGFGQLSRLAQALGVSPALISQILKGLKNLTEDQCFTVAEFFGFSETEAYYFLLLVQKERAANHKLKGLIEKQLQAHRREAQKLKSRVTADKVLSTESQAIFYSDWLFTALHTMSSIAQFQSVDAMATHLGLPRPKVLEAVNWLLQQGLCRQEKGRLVMGPSTTFVEKGSPLALRHHANWRLKALETMGREAETDFFFTAPFSVSERDFEMIRQELIRLVETVAKRVKSTTPELMATINLDLFKG